MSYAKWFSNQCTEKRQRQRINLSDEAYRIVLEDIDHFYGETVGTENEDLISKNITNLQRNFSGFINRIIENYYLDSNATVSVALSKRENELKEIFKKSFPDSNANKIISILLKEYEKKLQSNVNSKIKGIGFNIYISANNYARFYEDTENEECKYHDSQTNYFKDILEDYASLPKNKREEIYFATRIKEVQGFINNNTVMQLTIHDSYSASNKEKFLFKGYKIITSPATNHLYLVGYKFIENKSKWEQEFVRISRIDICNGRIKPSGKISERDIKSLEESLEKTDVAFLKEGSGPVDIKIRFLENGLRTYRKVSHMQPRIFKTNTPGVYTMHCPVFQAYNYLLRLHSTVEVLEPKELRDKIADTYKKAYSIYSED